MDKKVCGVSNFLVEGLTARIMGIGSHYITWKLEKLTLRSILWFRFCDFYGLLVAILKQGETVKSAHEVAVANWGRLKECNCNQMQLLSIFFGLSLLSIDIQLVNKAYNSQNLFWVWLLRKCEMSVANSWERGIGCEMVRLVTKSWDLASLSHTCIKIHMHDSQLFWTTTDWYILIMSARWHHLRFGTSIPLLRSAT